MIPWAYYNEFDAETAAWLQSNIDAGLIAPGCVDTRSITEVRPDDLLGFTQCHFFAGIGGWSYAARLAGWPDERPFWSGSCPCQPFSAAGKGAGVDDPRHLWPDFHRLIGAGRPAVVVGEQVAGAAGYGWFDGVGADLESEGYACRAVDVPALAVDAPHQRNRLYWVGIDMAHAVNSEHRHWRHLHGPGEDSEEMGGGAPSQPHRTDGRGALGGVDQVDAARLGRGEGRAEHELRGGRDAVTFADAQGNLDDAEHGRRQGRNPQGQRPSAALSPDSRHLSATDGGGSLADGDRGRQSQCPERNGGSLQSERQSPCGHNAGRRDLSQLRNGSWWAGAEWIQCHDGKARRVANASAPLLVDGFPNRILSWRGLGNAIVPPLAAEVLGALMDVLE